MKSVIKIICLAIIGYLIFLLVGQEAPIERIIQVFFIVTIFQSAYMVAGSMDKKTLANSKDLILFAIINLVIAVVLNLMSRDIIHIKNFDSIEVIVYSVACGLGEIGTIFATSKSTILNEFKSTLTVVSISIFLFQIVFIGYIIALFLMQERPEIIYNYIHGYNIFNISVWLIYLILSKVPKTPIIGGKRKKYIPLIFGLSEEVVIIYVFKNFNHVGTPTTLGLIFAAIILLTFITEIYNFKGYSYKSYKKSGCTIETKSSDSKPKFFTRNKSTKVENKVLNTSNVSNTQNTYTPVKEKPVASSKQAVKLLTLSKDKCFVTVCPKCGCEIKTTDMVCPKCFAIIAANSYLDVFVGEK